MTSRTGFTWLEYHDHHLTSNNESIYVRFENCHKYPHGMCLDETPPQTPAGRTGAPVTTLNCLKFRRKKSGRPTSDNLVLWRMPSLIRGLTANLDEVARPGTRKSPGHICCQMAYESSSENVAGPFTGPGVLRPDQRSQD